ncbi:MAG: hypothetical protein K2K93_07685 [Muribaculaceae bacterium]|nr:hypothetical protein [Muribaculaceae bacterium]
MKGFLTAVMCAAFGFSSAMAALQPEAPDTLNVIDGADRITVSRKGDTTTIKVEKPALYGTDVVSYDVVVKDDDDSEPNIDFELPFGIGKKDNGDKSSARRLRTYFFTLGNIYIGQRFNYSDKGNVKNSIEGGWRDVIGMGWSLGKTGPSFSIGAGFGFKRYHAQDGFVYAKEGSNLVIVPAAEGCTVKSTELNVFNFQVPLIFTVPLGSDVKFAAGAVGCFNTYAMAHTEILKGNSKYKTVYKGLQQRLFTAEFTCTLGLFDIIGVYASWSPMTLFQSPYGPQLKSWSIGATVNF